MNLFLVGFPPWDSSGISTGGLGLGSATYQLTSQAGPKTFDDLPKEPILRVGRTHRHSELQRKLSEFVCDEFLDEFVMNHRKRNHGI